MLPPIDPNEPHLEEISSVEDDLVARASYDYLLFKDDNAGVCYYLE